METIIDFYKELNLDSSLKAEEIMKQLVKQESVWHQREIATPEKAREMLVLIDKAKLVFTNKEAKDVYDKNLANYKVSENEKTQDDNHAYFNKWYSVAMEYFNNNQYDLSKTAIEKAALYYDTNDENVDYLADAADIYRYNNDYENALKYINEAIVIEPQNLMCILIKGAIYYSMQEYKKALDCFKFVHDFANASGDKEYESLSQSFIANILYYGMKDYVAAESAANQAIELGDTTGVCLKILEELNQPSYVSLDELKKYEQEEIQQKQDIVNLIHQIITSGLIPESNNGWLLSSKFYFGEYNPNKDGFDEEDTINYDYYLNLEGKFICKTKINEDYFTQAQGYFNNNKESIYECSLSEIMKEMDFEGYICYDNGSAWHEHGSRIQSIESKGVMALQNNGTLDIKRFSKKKGQGLYKKLKSIIDDAAAYIEECNRINSIFDAEYEKQKQSINAEFEYQRNRIQQEMNNKLESAKQNESQIVDLQNKIKSCQKELSSLGLFSGKRKKELQTIINNLKCSLADLDTVEDVSNTYNNALAELYRQEQTAITRLKQELREKYPLPSQK